MCIERCKHGFGRGLRRPTIEMWQGGAFLLYPDLLRKYQHKLLAAAFLYIRASALTDWCPVTIKFDNFAIKIDNLQLCLIKTASQRN